MVAIAPRLGATTAAAGVVGWWCHESTGAMSTIVPDGEVDLMWSPGRTPWLAGPDTGPRTSLLPASVDVVGVRLERGAAAAFVRDSATALTDRLVELDSVVDDRTCRAVRSRLDDARTSEVGPLLADLVQSRIGHDWRPDPIVAEEVERIRQRQPASAQRLSPRQLRRRFSHAVGYGPKFFDRICRIDHFLDVLQARPAVGLAEAAAIAGFYDQAHLTRTCRDLTGRTPAAHRGDRTGE